MNPFSTPSTPPIGPWISPRVRLLLLVLAYLIVRTLYAIAFGH